ncbi:MAG TPA: transporter permease, partial [Cytophagales bacterium]|nr:transporter permease [Cytophagales bacterium]
EVGIKKALGARKPLLTGQFMEEAFVHVLLALVGAYLLTAILLPGFNQFTGKSLSLWSGWQLLLVMLGVALAAGWVAGSYPALYLSRLSPIRSLKGQNQPGTRSLTIRRGLVVFQFTLSVIFILGVIIIAQQMAYIQNKDLGFNKDQIIYFSHDYVLEDDTDTYYTFLEDLRQLPEVSKAASFSHDLAGNHGGTSGLTWPGKDPDTRIEFGSLEVGPGFLDALSVPMVAGSTFPPPSSDTLAKIIFNEAAIAAMGLTDPVGKIITLWGEPKEIVGVTKNIHFESLYEPITPCFFNMYPVLEKTLVKAETENLSATLAAIRAIHDRYSPNHPLTFQFMDDDFAKQYAAEQQLGQLSRYFAGIAILISCLGLLSLAAFSAQRRRKEIGIRKTLGANPRQLIFLLSKEFTFTVLIGILLAQPISYWLADGWLSSFAFHETLTVWPFVFAACIALLMAWLTVGVQTFGAARLNPVSVLKEE